MGRVFLLPYAQTIIINPIRWTVDRRRLLLQLVFDFVRGSRTHTGVLM